MKPNKRIIIYISIAIAVLAIAIGTFSIAYSSSSNANSLLSLGEKYLSELEYEKAIVEFTKVIEIDPMNVRAYIGLAKAYIGLGDTQKAIEALELGYEKTRDWEILKMLEELREMEKPAEPTPTSIAEVTPATDEISSETTEPSSTDSETAELSSTEEPTPTSKEETTPTPTEESTPIDESGSNVTIFSDKAFEKMIRKGLNKADGEPVFQSELDEISVISIVGDFVAINGFLGYQISSDGYSIGEIDHSEQGDIGHWEAEYTEFGSIRTLNDVKYFPNLTSLGIEYNQITDLSPLSDLTQLTKLRLAVNQITNISALSSLTNLTQLSLDSNQISDISPLKNLANLTFVFLGKNPITDLSPVAHVETVDVP